MDLLTFIILLTLMSIMILIYKPIMNKMEESNRISLTSSLNLFNLKSPFYTKEELIEAFIKKKRTVRIGSRRMRNLILSYEYLEEYLPVDELLNYLLDDQVKVIPSELNVFLNEFICKFNSKYFSCDIKIPKDGYTTSRHFLIFDRLMRNSGKLEDEELKVKFAKIFKMLRKKDPRSFENQKSNETTVIFKSKVRRGRNPLIESYNDLLDEKIATLKSLNISQSLNNLNSLDIKDSEENNESLNISENIKDSEENNESLNINDGKNSKLLKSVVINNNESKEILKPIKKNNSDSFVNKEKENHYCESCDRSYNNNRSLERHYSSKKHKKMLQEAARKSKESKSRTFLKSREHHSLVTCSTCGKVLNNRSELILHIKDNH